MRRLLSRKGFSAERRGSLLRQVRERGSVYLTPINAVYVRQFRMTSAAEDATRFLHQACRGLPNLSNGKTLETRVGGGAKPLDRDDAFYATVVEHALAFFGSRILYPARPALRDTDLAELFDVTREDLEHQASLPFADAVDALNFLIQHRAADLRCTQVPACNGRKYEYIAEQLGYLTGNDLYDAYLEGRLNPTALRKLFLAHVELPGVARESYAQLRARLRPGRRD